VTLVARAFLQSIQRVIDRARIDYSAAKYGDMLELFRRLTTGLIPRQVLIASFIATNKCIYFILL